MTVMDQTVSMFMLTILLAALTTMVGGRQRKARRRQAGKQAGQRKGPARKGQQGQLSTQLQLIRADIPRAPSQVTTRLVKWDDQKIYSGNFADATFSEDFRLNLLQENGAMLIMWAEYKIVEIERTYRPMYRMNFIAEGPAVGTIPLIYVIYSPDQQFAPGGVASFQRYQGVVINDDSRSFTVKFRPKVALSVYDGIITSAYTVGPPSWLQTIEPSIPHFGLHTLITGSGILGGPFQQWNVTTRYTIDFRIVR